MTFDRGSVVDDPVLDPLSGMDGEVLAAGPFERHHVLCNPSITLERFGEMLYRLAAVRPALVSVKSLNRVLEIREAAFADYPE